MSDYKQRLWFIDKLGKLGIIEKSTNTVTKDGVISNWTSITEAKPFRIYAVSQDMDLDTTSFTNTFNQIPSQFHEGIVYKVIASGYKEPRNQKFEAAQYFDNEYNLVVKEAKKFSKSNYRNTYTVKQQDF